MMQPPREENSLPLQNNAADRCNPPLLEVRNLNWYFTLKERNPFKKPLRLQVLHNVSLSVERGKTLGIVGESGSGKTTLLRIAAGMYKPSQGDVFFEGRNIRTMSTEERLILCAEIQMIFQDPYSSLDPRMTAEQIISEPLHIFEKKRIPSQRYASASIREQVMKLAEQTGLPPQSLSRFPCEFSGGQRQRIGIARALALNPKLILADEPLSALDVSSCVRILDLLRSIQKKTGISYIFVSHDLALVRCIADHIAVVYGGHIVESAPAEELYQNPLHPYSRALLDALLPIEKEREDSLPPSLKNIYSDSSLVSEGCPFAPKCPRADTICFKEKPLSEEREKFHKTACFFAK